MMNANGRDARSSNEEIWNIDRTTVVRRIVFEAMYDDTKTYEQMKGGQWMRQAADLIAKDMLANQAVKVEQHYDLDRQVYRLSYVAKVGQPNSWRILP